jgi:prepilin-type N-terminal cleavage/methylation domain-containing protein
MRSRQSGFTLIEIAIVLVIIGLLLGGVLKGQELITNARVRNMIATQDGIKAAFFGFQDRYRAVPGDYAQAMANITGATFNGNGNGVIEAANNEHLAVWEHLSRAGFITGLYTAGNALNQQTSPTNPYSMFLVLNFDALYDGPNATPRHNLKTGNQVPSHILAEVDTKIDDGRADQGAFRFSTHAGLTIGTPPTGVGSCYTAANGLWVRSGAIVINCGGTSIF